jgi:membrane-bound lytic murein transglycosylase D
MNIKINKIAMTAILIIVLSSCATHFSKMNPVLEPITQSSNLWQDISNNFRYKQADKEKMVQSEIRNIQHNPKYITNLTANAKPYIYYVYQQVKKRHMPAEIALLPMVESGYNPFLYSHQGATGLWQLMPGTATGLGLRINWWYDDRRDIIASTNAALNYLDYLHHFFHDWQLAIAAYNAGEGTVLDAIRYNQRLHKPTDFWHLALPAETKTYLPKLLAIATVINNPKLISTKITFVANTPYLTKIKINKQYNLSVLANLANTSEENIRELNPGFRRFSTEPGPHDNFIIPAANKSTFNDNLKTYKGHNVTWRHHAVIAGDNLSSLAKTYHTNVGIIKEVNNLKTNFLSLHQVLLIPVSLHHHNITTLATTSKQIAEDNIPGPSRVEYRVAHTDTLSSIAKKFNVSEREIKYWNQIQSPYIRIGRTLTIWQKHYIPKHSYFQHTVAANETLSSISHKYSATAQQLRTFNHLKDNNIFINQVINVPYPQAKHYHPKFRNQLVIHYVKAGDSISSLAHYYRINKDEIMQLNHLHKGQLLKLGQPIKIYFSAR